jgi:hypothetical protein
MPLMAGERALFYTQLTVRPASRFPSGNPLWELVSIEEAMVYRKKGLGDD